MEVCLRIWLSSEKRSLQGSIRLNYIHQDAEIRELVEKRLLAKAFSAYAKTADTSIPITFKNQEEKNAYITKLKNRNGVSSIIKNIPKKDEPIYTFATCSYEGHDYRTYVHAVEK